MPSAHRHAAAAAAQIQSKQKIRASEVDLYTAALQNAIKRMIIINKCADTELSFERAPFDGSDTDYVNPSSPTDFLCHVFHPSGGAVGHRDFDFADAGIVTGRNLVLGHGLSTISGSNGDSNDMMFLLPNIELSICQALNKKNSATTPPYDPIDITVGNASSPEFIGSYGASNSYFNVSSSTAP
jgi:hypothetical protein